MTWLTAAEALRVLHVRPQTLYANVSRNKIRAKPDPKDTRRSLYYEIDVQKLARKQGGRRNTALVAAGAIERREPVLSSSISTVMDERLYYRGKDAVVLSEAATLEEAAGLLWSTEAVDLERARRAELAAVVPGIDGGQVARAFAAAVESGLPHGVRGKSMWTPLQRAFYALGKRASTDLSSFGRALVCTRS